MGALRASSLVAAVVLAGCASTVIEPPEAAAAKKPVDLADVLGVRAATGKGGYAYHSAAYNGTWTAFRVPVPPETVLVGTGQFPRYAPLHLVLAFLEDGRVVEASRPATPREADPRGPVAIAFGFVPIGDGRAVETFAHVAPTLAAAYANLTVHETPMGMPTEVLLIVGAMPAFDEPRPLDMAVAFRVGGVPPAGLREDDYRAALEWMAEGGRGEARAPLATGGGLALSIYDEWPATVDAAAGSRARGVQVTDTGGGTAGVGGGERELTLRATREGAGRTYAAAHYRGAADVGAWAWRYDPPGPVNASGAHAWASANAARQDPAQVFAIRNEASGTFDFEARFATKATVAPDVHLLLMTLGADLPAVFGVVPQEIPPASEGTFPDPVDEALRGLLGA